MGARLKLVGGLRSVGRMGGVKVGELVGELNNRVGSG